MSNKLIIPAEFQKTVARSIKEQADGDAQSELVLWIALGASLNGANSPAAKLLRKSLTKP